MSVSKLALRSMARARAYSAAVHSFRDAAPLMPVVTSHKTKSLAAGLVLLTAGGMGALQCEEKRPTPADEACMCSAASSARVGIRLEHGGPFGASVVRDGVIISCAHNMVLHNKDPTCHAEMTAIRAACKALGTHDLSDCHLYTTCEPCPMCWGAVQWSRVGRAYIGVDRHIAAKYGFDDKVFYDEVDVQAGVYGVRRSGYILDSSNPQLKPSAERVDKNMVEIHNGVMREQCEDLFTNTAVNRSLKRRYNMHTADLHDSAKKAFPEPTLKSVTSNTKHEMYMQLAIEAATRGVKSGVSKEREPFGTVIVKDGVVIAQACNTVTSSRDCTSTSEVNAIVAACANLGTYNLEGCDMYTVVQPDVMSLGAILWSRMSRVYCGVTQQFAAQYGFEEGSLHFQDLQLTDKAHRVCEVVDGVSVEECESVFKEWSDRNGVIY